MGRAVATPRSGSSAIRVAVVIALGVVVGACVHVDGTRTARRLSSSEWLASIALPGNDVTALASLSWSATVAPSGGGPWDFHGRPFSTTDGVSVYETYTRVDAAGRPYRSYAKLRGGPCIDARELARRIGAGLDSPGHPQAELPAPVYHRDSGSTLLYLHARRGDHCLVEISARRKG